ncbi:MAG: CapA family protein [Bacilli bacterium]|nr:CapA family protein [Bacilli bacterium]
MRRKKRKIRIKIKSVIILLLIIMSLLFCISYLISKINSDKSTYDDKTVEDTYNEIPLSYETSLVMVGDALIHDSLYNDAKEGNSYNFYKYLSYIKEYVSDYDIAYYNQETILGGTSIGLSSYPSFNSPQELGDAMVDAGFNLVSLATNHTLDRGANAVKLSRQYWNKQEGVHAVGSYSSFDEKQEIESKILESNGITYSVLNYTYGTNGIQVPSGKDYLVNLWDDTNNFDGYKKKVKSDIDNIRDKVDVLIVAMHWGREYTHNPIDIQKKTAKYLASLGVDLIIGTHPHVIQPVEYIDDTLVFYSLGNFISAQKSESCSNYKCFIGLMSSLKIKKEIINDETVITFDNINNELIYTYHNNYKDYLVIPFSNKDIKKYLPDYKNVYNKYVSYIATDDDRIKINSVVK